MSRGQEVPSAAVEAVRASAPGAVEVAVTDAPEVNLRFPSREKAGEFFVRAYARTVLARDLKVLTEGLEKTQQRHNS